MDRTFNPEFNPTVINIALTLIILTAILWIIFWRQPPVPLPPGPRGYPLLGNLFVIPPHQSQSWLTFAKWGDIYGTHLPCH